MDWISRAGMVIRALVLMAAEGCAPPLPHVDTTEGTGTEDTDTSDTGNGECGDGIVGAGETCDDEGESATCDVDCTDVVCGDGSINAAAGEACEGTDLAGETCTSLGFAGGTLACNGCALDTSGCQRPPSAPVLQLGFSQVKQFDFSWAPVSGADRYQLLESPTPGEPFGQLGEEIVGDSISISMPLHFRYEASYVLRACNEVGCADSEAVSMLGSLVEAVGYFKASNTDTNDMFGHEVALSGDGSTLAVGASLEDGSATGIGGSQSTDAATDAGAVYVFMRDGTGQWSQQAYVKASNTDPTDYFGSSLALSHDGSTLAVGAYLEDGGPLGDHLDDSVTDAGAVYVFARDPAQQWSQQAYLKASNAGPGDMFGYGVALSDDGNTLGVGAIGEDSSATGIGGPLYDDSMLAAGAAYVFVRSAASQWSQQAYVKASNTDAGDWFGEHVDLSGDGNTLAVAAVHEASSATGIGGEVDESAPDAGAVYVFVHDAGSQWAQQAYVKASNTDAGDYFGSSVTLSAAGDTLAVGARGEESSATGVGGEQYDDSAPFAGAVYVFARDGMDAWSQQAYLKASNTDANDFFGWSVALSGGGDVLAVGAHLEASGATGIDGDQADDSVAYAGAVYVFTRDEPAQWSQRSYVKASNTSSGHELGWCLALSSDADTLAVGAPGESSNATGIGGDQAGQAASAAGAVYLF